jgi:hypothetical protein
VEICEEESMPTQIIENSSDEKEVSFTNRAQLELR